MAKKEFTYQGKTLEQLQDLSLTELVDILPAPARRKMKRGFTEQEKIFLQNIRSSSKPVKTHSRAMIILPEMVNKMIQVHNGKEFVKVEIIPEMIGHRLGEYSLTRKRAKHAAPGIGAKKAVKK